MLLCVPCHSKNLEEKSLTDIANAFKAPWIGWQELSIAGLPLLPEESEAILSKLSDQSFAQTSVAAILEKNGKINEAIAALEKIEPGDQFRTKHVWRSRLYHTIDNEQLALKSLQMADQAFHTHKTPYGTQQIFINQTRMAFAMDQLDSLRSWLEWIIESNCSATLRWQAMQEILDLDYHQGLEQSFPQKPWVACLRASAQYDNKKATDLLMQGRETWWKDLSWDERGLLCENVRHIPEFTTPLVDALESSPPEIRRQILFSLLSIHADKSVLLSRLLKDRDLYEKILPDLILLARSRSINGKPIASLALEESVIHPDDFQRFALAFFTNQQNDLDAKHSNAILRNLLKKPIDLPNYIDLEQLHSLRLDAYIAIYLCRNKTVDELVTITGMSSAENSMLPKIHALCKQLIDYSSMILRSPEFTEDMLQPTEVRRVLQMFIAPDIARLRVVRNDYYEIRPINEGRHFHVYDSHDSLFRMGTPIRDAEIIDSRFPIKNLAVLEWEKIITARVSKGSPVANQIFLSKQLISVRSEGKGGQPRENYKPSSVYPAPTRALMEIQCNDLYRIKALHNREPMTSVLKDLPALGVHLSTLIGSCHSIGYNTEFERILKEHAAKTIQEPKAIIPTNTEFQLRNVLLQYLAGYSPLNFSFHFKDQPNQQEKVDQLHKELLKLGRDPRFADRDMLGIDAIPKEHLLIYAERVIKIWNTHVGALQILLTQAIAVRDAEKISQLLEMQLSNELRTPAYFPNDAWEILDHVHVSKVIELISKQQGSGKWAMHQSIASGLFSISILRYPDLLNKALTELIKWFPRTDYDRMSHAFAEIVDHLSLSPEILGEHLSWVLEGRAKALGQDNTHANYVPVDSQQETSWALLRQNGDSEAAAKAFEEFFNQRKKIRPEIKFALDMQIACRHANDEIWNDYIKHIKSSNNRVLYLQTASAAECYFDGCEQRATEWLDVIFSRLKNAKEPHGEVENGQRQQLATSLATAWIWIGDLAKADACKAWITAPQAKSLQSFFQRNESLTDSLALQFQIARSNAETWTVYWNVTPHIQEHEPSQGLWPIASTDHVFKIMAVAHKQRGSSRKFEFESSRELRGSFNLPQQPGVNEIELRLSSNDEEWSERRSIADDPSSDHFINSIELAPLLLANVNKSSLRVTAIPKEQSWSKGDVIVSGWVPTGGVILHDFSLEPNMLCGLSGMTTSLTDARLTFSPRIESTSSNGQSSTFHLKNYDPITWHNVAQGSNALYRVDHAKVSLRLLGANKDGSGFVAFRTKNVAVGIYSPALEKGLDLVTLLPAQTTSTAIDHERKIVIGIHNNRVVSSQLDKKSFYQTHVLGMQSPMFVGFTKTYAMAIDQNNMAWVADPKEMIFRQTGRVSESQATRIVCSDKGNHFAVLANNDKLTCWSIEKRSIHLRGELVVPQNKSFRFYDEDGKILVRNLSESFGDLYDGKTNQPKRVEIPESLDAMVAYYSDYNVQHLPKDKIYPNTNDQQRITARRRFQDYVSHWSQGSMNYSRDGKYIFLIRDGIVRRADVAEIMKK